MDTTFRPHAPVEPPLRERDPLTRLLRTRPLLTASLLFLAGCALQFTLELPQLPLWFALGVLAISGACLLRAKPRLAAALLALAFLPGGMLRFDAAWTAVEPLPVRKSVTIEGRISDSPEYRAENPRTLCTLNELRIDGAPENGKLLLYLRGDEAALQEVRLGQQIRVSAHLWQSDSATNPGQFDASNYRRAKGLRNYATADIADAEFTDTPARLGDLPARLRASLGERIDRLFPHNSALARALVLGDRSGMGQEERESYSRAGAAHLLAISGMHLSALALMVSLLLGRFLHRDAAYWLTLALLVAYGLLIGFVPSLTRALIMYAIFGFAPIAGRRSDGMTRLGAAMLIYLLLQPAAVLDAGFALSYAATAGIILLRPPLSRLPLLRDAMRVPPELFRPARRLLYWAADALVLSLAAQLAILPAVVHFYGAQPLWSPLTNLVAAPLTMVAYMLALPATLFNLTPLAAVADALFSALTLLVRAFAALPLAQLRVARFPLWLDVLCVFVYLAASGLSRLPERVRTWLPFAVLLAIPLSNLLAWCTTLGVSAVFLDAGQADCAVLRCEGHVYLIDVGDSYSPVADYLSAMNYTPDAVFLTHPHTDHAGGLADMLEVCAPERIYLSENWEQFEIDDSISEALTDAQAQGSQIVPVSAGAEIALSAHTNLRVLSPKAGVFTDSANEDSLILRLEYASARALFLADVPADVSEGLCGDADLIKVAHHGARDGTSAALLAETSPSVAVISVGRDNSYGHPVPRVLELLAAAGARVLRTDQSGAITCRFDEDGSLTLRGYLPTEEGNGLE